MSRLISIECDPTEVRVAVGTSGLTGVSLEHVVAAPLILDASEDLLGSVKTFQAVQSLLKQIGVRSGNAIVCVGRSNVELRSLTLPTVDKNELPDMVRFAAQRQFANAGESWPVDYVVIPSNHENMTDCLAATINPAIVDRIGKIVESLGLSLSQVVLRPLASATMAIVKQPALASTNVLLMELFRDEADMAIIERGHVVFMRNVRFSQPLEGAVNHQALQAEIKRTLISAASQRTDLAIDEIRIWGSQQQHTDTCKSLSEALKVNVATLDPLELLDASKTVRAEAGNNSGKFASVVGALLAPQVSARLIDFSNPKKREEKKRPLRTYALAGTVAAVLLGGGYLWYRSSHSALDGEIQAMEADIARNAESIKISSKKLKDWEKVETFLEGDYNWLDELAFLSQKAAPADKVVFGATSFTIDQRSNASSISTKFVTRRQEDVPDIQDAYRDDKHSVRGTGISRSQDKTGEFPSAADLNIKLSPQTITDPRKSIATKSNATKTNAAKPASEQQPNASPTPPSPTPPEPTPDSKSKVGGA
jgi:Tfp pilus assembly PilM family ATPase